MSQNHNENDHECCGSDCGGDCNCDHVEKITICLDGDEEISCEVVGVFDANDREYIALCPEGDEELLFFRYTDKEEGFDLTDIESDEEFEKVSETFFEVYLDELVDIEDDSVEEEK